MQICAVVRNAPGTHSASVGTAGATQSVAIPAKAAAPGSAVNGGELLMLALATCYCNDIHREAARLGIPVESVDVEAQADFDGVGLAARNVRYRARVVSPAPQAEIDALLAHTDTVAEVHNTLRAGVTVRREAWDAAAHEPR